MKTKIILILIIVLLAICTKARINYLNEENARLSNNQEILLSRTNDIIAENQKYKVADSLNAVKMRGLILTIEEYKTYREKDAELIKQLKIGKSDLQQVVTQQTQTINKLSVALRDSVRVDTISNEVTRLKCFDYKSKWTDVNGCIDLKQDSVELQIINRESLKVVETVTRKRFLGFLWKTKKIKSRQIDVISENPATIITNVDYINFVQ